MTTPQQRKNLRALLNRHEVDDVDPRAVKAFFDYTDKGIVGSWQGKCYGNHPLEDIYPEFRPEPWEREAKELYAAHCFRAVDERSWAGKDAPETSKHHEKHEHWSDYVYIEDLAQDEPEFVLQVARATAKRNKLGFLGRHYEALMHLHGIYRMPDDSLQIVS